MDLGVALLNAGSPHGRRESWLSGMCTSVWDLMCEDSDLRICPVAFDARRSAVGHRDRRRRRLTGRLPLFINHMKPKPGRI